MVVEHAQHRSQALFDDHRNPLPRCRRKRGTGWDKRGIQPPVTPRTGSHKETLTPHEVRENAIFSEVVDVLNRCEAMVPQLKPSPKLLDGLSGTPHPLVNHVAPEVGLIEVRV